MDASHSHRDAAVARAASSHTMRSALASKPGDDAEAPDVEEPPDESPLVFGRLHLPHPSSNDDAPDSGITRPINQERKQSLLTQALLTSPSADHLDRPQSPFRGDSIGSTASLTSAADLTSDGGLTSPPHSATPSPPLPAAATTPHAWVEAPVRKPSITFVEPHLGSVSSSTMPVQAPAVVEATHEPRKRCIKFACLGTAEAKPAPAVPSQPPSVIAAKPAPEVTTTTKRPCMLRFACPSKPTAEHVAPPPPNAGPVHRSPSPAPKKSAEASRELSAKVAPAPDDKTQAVAAIAEPPTTTEPTPSDLAKERSKALRCNVFAGGKLDEDEWVKAQPAPRCKLTVNDTLKKENDIRKLAEEADKEAAQEAAEDDDDEEQEDGDDNDDEQDPNDDEDDDDDDDQDNQDDEDDVSQIDLESLRGDGDDGNESDDEEGFAESDDESNLGSDYQFWTPGVLTAATSQDFAEPMRPPRNRSVSESSLTSGLHETDDAHAMAIPPPERRRSRPRKNIARAMTPELPDSTDFVCGTLDEDRPLEAAYLSCKERRRAAKHRTVPQDVDPSFPTSDPEDDSDDAANGDDQQGTAKPPDRRTKTADDRARSSRRAKSPVPSPPRRVSPAHAPRRGSPAPLRRRPTWGGSPPTILQHRLFGRSPCPLRTPPAGQPNSPPASAHDSDAVTGRPTAAIAMPLSHIALAQRPQLTHTKSLPRTPNPFWREHRAAQKHKKGRPGIVRRGTGSTIGIGSVASSLTHSRGPIDIVQGLEQKKARRRERYLRLHGRQAARERDAAKRSQQGHGLSQARPGVGAARMRELGLEVADRCKAYGQRAQLMLSI